MDQCSDSLVYSFLKDPLHPTLPSLKLKDAIWKSLDSKRPLSYSGNLTFLLFCIPWPNHLSTTP